LIRAPLSITSVLDETADAVSLAAAPWSAFVILTSIPYRFLQVLFIDRLAEVGSDAAHYGRLLGTTANWTLLAFIVSLWGRAVWARACRIAATTGARPGAAALRVPLVAFVSYLFTASIAEVLFYGTMLTFIGPIVVVLFAGLAIGTMELNVEVSLRQPMRLITRYAREVRTEFGVAFVFGIGLLIALVNLATAFDLGLWLARGFGSADIGRWNLLIAMGNRVMRLLLYAGTILAVEPFWVAANVVLVRKAGAAESGEELRTWFRELQEERS